MAKPINEKSGAEDVGFYAVIPATVRYDKSVPQGARLLYGEITALAKKKGYCWARNEYFANLYDTSERTIIEWIGRLRDAGHISIYLEYFPNSKKIYRRYISLPYRADQELPPELAKSHLVVKKSSPPEEDLMVKETSPLDGLMVKETSPLDGLMVKETSPPSGEENSLVINTNSINTLAAADPIPQNFEKPPPEEEAAAFSGENIDSLKSHFAGLDKGLIFDSSFYPRLLLFLSENSLGLDYVSWVYSFCLRREPKSLSCYLFTVIFEPRYVALYREASRPPPVVTVNCPVCGHGFVSSDASCPVCGFEKILHGDLKEVNEAKAIYSMSPDIRNAYSSELDDLISSENISDMEFMDRVGKMNAIKQKYGLL